MIEIRGCASKNERAPEPTAAATLEHEVRCERSVNLALNERRGTRE